MAVVRVPSGSELALTIPIMKALRTTFSIIGFRYAMNGRSIDARGVSGERPRIPV
jgi:hypothetical protein